MLTSMVFLDSRELECCPYPNGNKREEEGDEREEQHVGPTISIRCTINDHTCGYNGNLDLVGLINKFRSLDLQF